jgi:hypothetical protein
MLERKVGQGSGTVVFEYTFFDGRRRFVTLETVDLQTKETVHEITLPRPIKPIEENLGQDDPKASV